MLNVNRALYSVSGIDTQNVEKTANQILQKSAVSSSNANEQIPTIQTIDYSKFNRANLGIDLYSARTNVDLQKQISLTQAGIINSDIDVSKLNALAAQNLYNASTVRRNVELAQSVDQNEPLKSTTVAKETSNIQLFNASDKNPNAKNGYNPFLEGLNNNNDSQEKSEQGDLNLFA